MPELEARDYIYKRLPFWAWLLGKRITQQTPDGRMTHVEYRGVIYVTKIEPGAKLRHPSTKQDN